MAIFVMFPYSRLGGVRDTIKTFATKIRVECLLECYIEISTDVQLNRKISVKRIANSFE